MPSWWSEPDSGHAFILSLVSIIVTLIAAIIGIVGYAQLDDSLILIYGLENVVDFFSSAIVLWRFNDNHSSADNDPNSNHHASAINTMTLLQNREKRASIGVSIVLAVLGFGGLITAVDDLASGFTAMSENDKSIIYYISFTSFIVFGILAKFKFHYANKLKSPSLRKDGLCSLIGCVLGFAMFFNLLLSMMSSEKAWWWLDPTVAFLCAVGALGYGLYGMYKAYVKDGYPIFNCQWWLYGGGKIEEQRRSQQQQQNGQDLDREIGGGLELQTSTNNDSMTGNPSMSTPTVSSVSMMQSKSEDDEMSDIVIT
mmetsp:Transcript_13744/g.17336  ORF Transcript_13744/g.17336 Transcript_13744/m.17336 type:complete len:312 (-) Transcript_13744:99-1034(-)|eukprot:CAMPEP_0203648724 /NCGR_PEP_ID=MMETSP0088-20131115/19612_1 /ASSEMBLY_ACC=CAM_ASM_001087 /TAXON_ID=426623 /ORGANISM="Chaetoceros affinis, Strain CCMP159" /LENGTH=311 /DNA_ID=CAMNT_0050506839 /DNA_START=151 /DNA_END=1086 /DNA_ORIENTATION=-